MNAALLNFAKESWKSVLFFFLEMYQYFYLFFWKLCSFSLYTELHLGCDV